MKFEIWQDGFMVQGMEQPQQPFLLAIKNADTFDDAVTAYVVNDLEEKHLYSFRNGTHYIWGCRLSDKNDFKPW
jgi:hypothetical protein